jgi:ATP-dependent RNA helicase RhlE
VNFEDFKFHPHVAAGVTALGYETPTPIQTDAIPPVLAGRDVMGLAQTGTGKTAAFGLPILNRLMTGPRRKVRALIIAPTRELAEQIHESISEMGQKTGLKSATIYGGVGMNPQIQKLRAGAEIVVACPGRLLDHIQRGTINLSGLEVLVLDEADQMFDMGFLPAIRQVIKNLPAKRQNLLFSATMPDDIRRLAREILNDAVTVEIGHKAPLETVSHALYPVEQHLKNNLLMEILKDTDTESVLVFTRTKHRAKRVAQQLAAAGHRATCLQGNLSQNARQAALNGFRDGTYQILVATDIAARGIDVSSISHVVNFDMPNTAEAYTHRIGRTGRAAKTGDAYTMVSQEDEAMVRTIERVMGSRLERRHVKGFEYSAPAPPSTDSGRGGSRGPRRQPSGSGGQGSRAAVGGGGRGSAPSGGGNVTPWSQARRSRAGR